MAEKDAATVKVAVEALGQFKRDMSQAANSVKTLGSETKLAESEFRKTGNAATYVQQKTAALTKQIEAQQKAVEAANRGLEMAIRAYGEGSKQAQEWTTKLNNAKSAMNDLETELSRTASGTDRLQGGMKKAVKETQALDSIRLQGFSSALTAVSGLIQGLENTARNVARSIWSMATDSASWADTLATDAARYGTDTRTLQRWQYAARFVDVEASTIATAHNRLLSSMRSTSEATTAAFGTLGVQTRTATGELRQTDDVFWDTIGALERMNDETARDAAAQQIFGRSFGELRPLILAGRDAWEAYGDEAERAGLILSDAQVGNLGSFNDSLDRMNASFDMLKYSVMSELAPGFELITAAMGDAAQALGEWLQTAEGQETIGKFTDAIIELVKTLADGGLQKLLEGAIGLFERLADVAGMVAQNPGGAIAGWLGLQGVGKLAEWGGQGALMYGGAKLLAKGMIGAGAGGAGAAGAGAAGAGAAGAAGSAAAAAGAAAETATAAAATTATTATTATAAAETATAAAQTATAATKFAAGAKGLLTTVGVPALGFGLGILSVLGVGELVKAMAGPAFNSDDIYANGFEGYEKSPMAADLGAIEEITRGIYQEYGKDFRTDQKNRLSAEDVTAAINAARLPGTTVNNNNNYNVDNQDQTEIQISVANLDEALDAATYDGVLDENEFVALQGFVINFGLEVKETQDRINAGWVGVADTASKPTPEAMEIMMRPVADDQMAAYIAMTTWVAGSMGTDFDNAIDYSAALWTTMAQKAGSPEALGIKMSQMTGQQAFESGDESFTAMVGWIMANVEPDYDKAVALAIQYWDSCHKTVCDPDLEPAVYMGTAEGSPYTGYVSGYEGDYEAAKATVDGWYNNLDSRLSEGGGDVGHGDASPTHATSYLKEQVGELNAVYDDWVKLLAELLKTLDPETMQIKLSPETVAAIDDLRRRQDEITGNIAWYDSEEYAEGAGALELAWRGEDLEHNAPRAVEHIEAVREHEIERINQEVADLASAMGVARAEYQRAVGDFGHDSAEAQEALEKLQKATKDYEEAEASKESRIARVEQEYRQNMMAIDEGGLAAVGYKGTGKATAQHVAPEEVQEYLDTLAPVPLYGQTVTGGHGWSDASFGSNPWAGTEFGRIIEEGQQYASETQKNMMEMLREHYGSWHEFYISLSETDRKAMDAIMSTPGDERDWWQTVRYGAFGDLPTEGYGGEGRLGNNMQLMQNVFDRLSTLPTEADNRAAQTNAELDAAAEAYNEASRYNEARKVVEGYIAEGRYQNFDWTTGDYGWIEDIVADMVAEYEAAGEEIPAALGRGAEKSAKGKVFTSGMMDDIHEDAEQAGEYIDTGLAAGIRNAIPLIQAAASEAGWSADKAIRKILRIESPSKVMAGLGEYVGEGFALGIEDSVRSVQAATARMAAATSRPVAGYAGAARAAGNSYSSSSAVYVDKYYQNSGEDIDYISQQLDDMTQRQLAGYGHRG